MKNSQGVLQKITPQYFLDITTDTCPMTFVRTTLLIEQMRPGEIAEIRLAGDEPIRNVPRSISQQGHAVLSLEVEPTASATNAVRRLIFRKSG